MKHTEKARYLSQRKAIRAAIVYSRRGRSLRVYRCNEPGCGGGHLTSQQRRGRAARSA